MRFIYANRVMPIEYDDDVQKIINDKPSTATVYRKPANTVKGQTGKTVVGSFECRLDIYSPRPHGGEVTTLAGHFAERSYLLLARYGQDQFGNSINLKHGDEVVIDNDRYRATQVLQFPNKSKTEAVLSYVE